MNNIIKVSTCLILLILSGISLTSCSKEVVPIFTMGIEADFEVPAGLSSVLTHTFVIKNIKSPLDAYLDSYAVSKDDITAIQAGKGEIVSLFSSTGFDYVERVSVWMVDADDPDFRKEIYYLDFNNGNNDTSLRLLSGLPNVLPILAKDTFTLEVKLKFRGFSPAQSENRIVFNLLAIE